MTAPDALAGYRMTDGRLTSHTSIGSYPILYFVRADGCAFFCAECAEGEGCDAADVLWEGPPYECDACEASIASAYGDPENDLGSA